MLGEGKKGGSVPVAVKTNYSVKSCLCLLMLHSPGASFCHNAVS